MSSCGRGGKGASGVSSHKGTDPTHGVSTLMTSSPPKAPAPHLNASAPGVRIQHKFSGDTDRQAIPLRLLAFPVVCGKPCLSGLLGCAHTERGLDVI